MPVEPSMEVADEAVWRELRDRLAQAAADDGTTLVDVKWRTAIRVLDDYAGDTGHRFSDLLELIEERFEE
jgi:hypothetical protein